ncbi:unnamed protein product [Urochloa decumbens]|uniref:Uncharacterized protein n=1 Tax=Urochloa decumbens TaxID=240449 RepID=A0ABC9E6B6_9POAL
MSMATRAIAAVAGSRSGLAAVLSSFRRGGSRGMSHSCAQERRGRHDTAAAAVEASQNRKNVEVVQGEDRSATLLPDEAADALRGVGVGAADADDAWLPDQETGVFVPAEEAAAANGSAGGDGQAPAGAPPSVLDQTVFVRDEDMEDVERPAVDMASAHGAAAK